MNSGTSMLDTMRRSPIRADHISEFLAVLLNRSPLSLAASKRGMTRKVKVTRVFHVWSMNQCLFILYTGI